MRSRQLRGREQYRFLGILRAPWIQQNLKTSYQLYRWTLQSVELVIVLLINSFKLFFATKQSGSCILIPFTSERKLSGPKRRPLQTWRWALGAVGNARVCQGEAASFLLELIPARPSSSVAWDGSLCYLCLSFLNCKTGVKTMIASYTCLKD